MQHFDSIISWRGTSAACYKPLDFFVYTIHFHEPLPHGKQAPTRHYTGMASDLDARLARHRAGNGAALMTAVGERGIPWELVSLIRCDTYQEAHTIERRLKKHSATRRCPVCGGKPLDPLTALRQGYWPLRLHSQVGRRQPSPVYRNQPMRGGVS